MLKLKVIPIALNIASKIDTAPIVEAVKAINDFKPTTDKEEAIAQIEAHKTEVGIAVIGAIVPQLGKISSDVVELVAAYKGVTTEEAGEMDAVAALKEIAHDAGVVDFFKSALQKKGKGLK